MKVQYYLGVLINVIGDLFSCEKIIDSDQNQNFVVNFIGFDANPVIASYAFDVLSKQLKKDRKDYVSKNLKRVRKRSNKIARADYYCLGWVTAVYEKIEDLIPANFDKSLIAKYLEASYADLKDHEPKQRSTAHAKSKMDNDLDNGVKDGKKAQLHNAINANKRQMLQSR